MRRTSGFAVVAVILALVVGACGYGGEEGDSGGTPTLQFYTFPEPSGSFQAAADECSKQSNGKYKIALSLLPRDADGQREQLVRRLAAEDSSVDLIAMDIIWTPEFAEAGWVKEWTGSNKAQATQGVLAKPVETATWQNKLYGAPFNSNTQLLWYRKDLVKTPPKTWDEMIDMAKQLPEAGTIQVQGRQYEGLSVWFNSLLESAGGSVLQGEKQEVALPEGPTTKAAEIMKRVATEAGDPSLANSTEDTARLAFEAGDAAFMVNYPFVYASAAEAAKASPTGKKVFENMGWALWPRVDANRPSKVSIGGINIGVGAFTDHPEEAFEAALCMRGPENQKRNATAGGLPPSIAALYDDPEVRKTYPFADLIRSALQTASLRPQSPAYNDISLAIQRTLHPPSAIDPPAVAGELKEKIESVLEGGLI
jgi:multiple sugar transport system substrate-binding protein